MKTNYEGFALGSLVYAIDNYYVEGKISGYLVIREAYVKDVWFGKGKTEYMLETSNGREWGDTVSRELVFDEYDEAIMKAKEVWEEHKDWD